MNPSSPPKRMNTQKGKNEKMQRHGRCLAESPLGQALAHPPSENGFKTIERSVCRSCKECTQAFLL